MREKGVSGNAKEGIFGGAHNLIRGRMETSVKTP